MTDLDLPYITRDPLMVAVLSHECPREDYLPDGSWWAHIDLHCVQFRARVQATGEVNKLDTYTIYEVQAIPT